MYNENKIEEKNKQKTEFEKLKEECLDLVFKPEGLGAIEFSKKIFLKTFNKEDVAFRIERIPMESFGKLSSSFENISMQDIKTFEKVLKNFIAYPVEAKSIDYFELDLDALISLINIIAEFQQKPFLFFEGTRK